MEKDAGYQLGTFPFTCPVTALLISCRRCLNLCTALSTWSPRFISRDLYLSLAIWAKRSFHFSPLKINGSSSKSNSALIAKPWEKTKTKKHGKILWKYKHHCSILISLLLSFNGLFAHERIHFVIISLIQKKARHKTIHMSCLVSSWCVHIPNNSFFFSFHFCHSYHH